jgi:hypothetical protein
LFLFSFLRKKNCLSVTPLCGQNCHAKRSTFLL